MQGPKSAVFTTVRARGGHYFHLDFHRSRLRRHGEILGIEIPDFTMPEGLEGLVRITISDNKVDFHTIPFYQEIHMEAEGISRAAPRWTRKLTGLKHGDWDPYRQISKDVMANGADVALLIHEYCIADGDRAMPVILDHDGTVWVSEAGMGGVDSITFEICRPAIIAAGFIINEGRLNERLVARAKEVVLLGTGMGAARLTVLDDVDIGDGSTNLQRVCISALGDDWL